MTSYVLHRAAGLSVAARQIIPGLPVAELEEHPDLVIHLGAAAPWNDCSTHVVHTADHTDERGRPVVEVGRNAHGFHFDYADGTHVWIDSGARDIWCTWPASATLEDTATYLTGPILGFALRLRGALALHASAVQVETRALILVGPHAAGKSTAAAALGRRGYAVIADDVLHVRREGREWLAEPCGGSLRLWPDGAALVFGVETQLPQLTPTWDKRALHLQTRGVTSVSAAVPLGGIVLLDPREDSARAPRLDPVTRSEALVLLAAHSSASHLLDDRGRAGEFQALSDIMGRVPCTRAVASSSPARFPAFLDLLPAWAQSHWTAHVR